MASAMSDTSRNHLDMFWELLDQSLNSALFVLLGLQITVIHFAPNTVLAVVLVLLVTLRARLISVGVPLLALRAVTNLPRGGWKILVWGGLRGGISVALAWSLPAGPARSNTYAHLLRGGVLDPQPGLKHASLHAPRA